MGVFHTLFFWGKLKLKFALFLAFIPETLRWFALSKIVLFIVLAFFKLFQRKFLYSAIKSSLKRRNDGVGSCRYTVNTHVD